MISMSVEHPDIEEFIDVKTKQGSITKANVSIRVTDEFMQAVINDEPFTLHWEDGERHFSRTVSAREIYLKNVKNNWDWAEAGFLFWDTIENNHLMSAHPEHHFAGTNPCITGDTLVQTVEGEIAIKDLVGKKPFVYTMGDDGELTIHQASQVWLSKTNASLVKVTTPKGSITCTPDHKIYTTNRGWVEASNLKTGDKIKGLNRKTTNLKHCSVALSGGKYEKEHRFIAKHFYDIDGMDVHHKNDDGFDNSLTTVEKLIKAKRQSTSLGKKVGSNWFVTGVEFLDTTEDVYDMSVPATHNFIANGMVVHNCGEQPLMEYGSCLLGSINLSEFVSHPFKDYAEIDYYKLGETIYDAVEAMNAVLDEGIELHPLKEQQENARKWRQIGLTY